MFKLSLVFHESFFQIKKPFDFPSIIKSRSHTSSRELISEELLATTELLINKSRWSNVSRRTTTYENAASGVQDGLGGWALQPPELHPATLPPCSQSTSEFTVPSKDIPAQKRSRRHNLHHYSPLFTRADLCCVVSWWDLGTDCHKHFRAPLV